VKYVESIVFIDSSGPMAQHEGMTQDVVNKLGPLIGNIGAVPCAENPVPSILDIFASSEFSSQLRAENGVTKLVFCVSSGERDGTSHMLIEHRLETLPPDVYFIFVTIGTDDVTKMWFEHLINKHTAHGKKFAVMREYADESIGDEFTRCVRQLLEH
jgi:hypothetical protein